MVLPNETFTIADIKGCGAIQQMWMTPAGDWRSVILRIYWDGEENPSVECPIGDFFCSGFGQCSQLSSLAVCLNPGSAFKCYWKMPFRKSAKITIQNLSGKDFRLYYQINYALGHVDENEAYFHAQFRRSNPTSGGLHTILDGVVGKGQYVGTYFAWLTTCRGWWAREKLNSVWIPTLNIPQFAVPVWRITFAALTILTKEENTQCLRRPIAAFTNSFCPRMQTEKPMPKTQSLGCIGGILPIRLGLNQSLR